MTSFWTTNPSVLLDKTRIFEMWPTKKMQYAQSLNAISRLVILLTIVGFLFTSSPRILAVGIITLGVIVVLYTIKTSSNHTGGANKEAFSSGLDALKSTSIQTDNRETNPETLQSHIKSDFEQNTKKNPFANVLLTDIGDNPDRKSAPPSFNESVHEDITSSVKKMVQRLNPEIKSTNKQLFGDLGENFQLDQSNRNFYSTANTRVVNDQGAFSQFLYGNMPSGKESGVEGAIQRVKDNFRYTLY